MNWPDYLRGFEEGRYEGSVSGRDSGLLGSLVQLAFTLVFLAIALFFLVCKGLLLLLVKLVKTIAGRS